MTIFNRYAGDMALHQILNKLWLLLAFSSITCSPFLLMPVEADWNYSTNPADYDLGWIAIGASPTDHEPHCTYCLNGLTYDTNYNRTDADNAIGPDWNISVGSYRCDGVQFNELWAYHQPSRSIIFNNFSLLLCVDNTWKSLGVLKLRQCNSSALSQQWRLNGSKVISAVPGPQGEEQFMVGEFPDKNTNPTTQVYEKYILLGSSVPNSSDAGFSYSSDFMYLSTSNLINRSADRFTTQGLLELTSSSLDSIVNGGFERSTIQAGSDIIWNDWTQAVPSYFSLCGWVIDYGPIDYVKSGLLQPEEGSYSIHLNTHSDTDHWGQVSQTIRTEVGSEYLLSFYFNGFPPQLSIGSRPTWKCPATYQEAQLMVRVTNTASAQDIISSAAPTDGTGVEQNFSINVMQSNSLTIGSLWQLQIVKFRASSNVITIAFRSLNFNSSCGPMVDNVSLERVKPKSFWEKKTFQIVVGIVAGLVLVAVILLGIVVGRKRYCLPEEDYSDLYKTENARIFSMKELSASTKKFSAVLGEGAFGTVYKADFPDGTMGAVKVEKPKQMHLSTSVLASEEIAVLLRVHHRNLVNLTGFCIHKGRQMLVFEYLPNGSLYDRLHQSVIPVPPGGIMDSIELRRLYANVLPWHKRTKIASDVAYGLEYLHHDADPPIVHRDVKSRNILLTATDSAKLADFGLSKSAPVDATTFQSVETMVRGSIGYLDPQYFLTGVFSAKSDVYSYGVVLLELISGHQAIYNAASLGSWAAPYLTSPSLYHELVDKKLNGKFEPDELESLVELSKMCMKEDSRTRPNMRQVVAFLNARNLVVAGGESSEQVDSTETAMSREEYHKMKALFIDFEAIPTHSGSGDNLFRSPQPRD
ncbi:unnamed protein product [Calypogeia fissa]